MTECAHLRKVIDQHNVGTCKDCGYTRAYPLHPPEGKDRVYRPTSAEEKRLRRMGREDNILRTNQALSIAGTPWKKWRHT